MFRLVYVCGLCHELVKTVVRYLIDRIKSLGDHTTGLIVLVWNVGKLHTKTLGW